MCLAVPMRVVEVRGPVALAEASGVRCEVRLDLVDEAGVGAYLLVHAGYAIGLLDEEEARETLALLEQMSSSSPRGDDP